MIVSIYGLWKVGEALPFYIGMTGDIVRRNKEHSHRMKSLGITLDGLRIIEEVPIEAGEQAERRWIAHFRAMGAELLNANDGGVGRPQIEGLKDFLLSLSIEDQAWFKEHLKGRIQPDGTKDNLSAWVRRQMVAHREQVEKDDLYAAQKGKAS